MPHILPVHEHLPEQIELIARIKKTLQQDNFFQSYLIIGARHLITFPFVQTLVKGMMCSIQNACGICKNCTLIDSMQHPDYTYVTNFDSNTIKVENVRDLQTNVYKSLSIAKYKIVVISPADKLNIQAASALLKILEEPPENTIFILLAENIMTLPVTIISRCHKYFMQDYSPSCESYFAVGEYYAKGEERFILLQNINIFLAKLLDLTANKSNACEIAAYFQEYKLENVLWFLYLFTAQVIKLLGNRQNIESQPLLNNFAKTQNLLSLFKQLDKIQDSIKAITSNITLNNNLCISNILSGFKLC